MLPHQPLSLILPHLQVVACSVDSHFSHLVRPGGRGKGVPAYCCGLMHGACTHEKLHMHEKRLLQHGSWVAACLLQALHSHCIETHVHLIPALHMLHVPPMPRAHVHLQAWANTPRNKGGLGGCNFPLVSDLTKSIARDYEVLIEDGENAGVSLR